MWYSIVLTALLPVIILLVYIYFRDRRSPEPVSQLLKGFAFGLVSVPLSLCISIPFGMLGLYVDSPVTVADCVRTSFFGAAIPEELAKLFMLWLLLRRNRYFDEKMDGIVYAVCVSMGFAALENLIYLFSNSGDYMSVGIMRGLFSIPGHFAFGIAMGYYYSMVKFYPKAPKQNFVMVFLVPILMHGVYDSLLFIIEVAPVMNGILFVVFILLCGWMWRFANRRIREHLLRDRDGSGNI